MDITIDHKKEPKPITREEHLANSLLDPTQEDSRIQVISIPKSTERIAELQKQLNELQERYNTDIAEWKAYEKSVLAWKAQVTGIVKRLQMELINCQDSKIESPRP